MYTGWTIVSTCGHWYRRARLLRQHRCHQVVILALVLLAEASAHVFTDDADPLHRKPEIRRQILAAVRDALRRGIECELLPLPRGQAHARFHLRVVHMRRGVAILENPVGGPEALLDASASVHLRLYFPRLVRRQIASRVNGRRTGLEGPFRVEHEREPLVFDLDQMQRVLCGMPINCSNCSHGVADESYGIVEQESFVPRVAAAPDDAAVLVSDDRLHARKLEGPASIDAHDPRMRMRAAQHTREKHARKTDVRCVACRAGDAFIRVDPWCGPPNRLHWPVSLRRLWSARSTRKSRSGDDGLDISVVVRAATEVSGQRVGTWSAEGVGFSARRAFAVISWPDVQKPHWGASCAMNAC